MRFELAQLAASWPLAASLALAGAAGSLKAGRRRTALNEALHELCRPLQALALTSGQRGTAGGAEGSLRLMTAAIERLDREINGAPAAVVVPTPVAVWPLAEDAVRRWGPAAASAGASLELCWSAGDAAVGGIRCELAQALDNLIVNAIEHGGTAIAVEAVRDAQGLRLAVIDCGRSGTCDPHSRRVAGKLARLSGRRRHGHGLRVVRRVAEAHGGSFRLHRRGRGTEAVLALPLHGVDGAAG